MAGLPTKKINEKFFSSWNSQMAYVLGYFVADGCIGISNGRRHPFTFNITSADREHLEKIKNSLASSHKISRKNSGSGNLAFQLQIRNRPITEDLLNLGLKPRKTYNLDPINVPDRYFADFVRGFFDGDGTVYIYFVNKVPQIKVDFISTSRSFIEYLNKKLCDQLNIPEKNIHINNKSRLDRIPMYAIYFYIDDCERLYKFLYHDKISIFLERKKKVFDSWKIIGADRRKYKKASYPSKIGWHLNNKIMS